MSYASEVLADSPVAWYRMQEKSGNRIDSSGNSNDLSLSSGTPLYEQTGPIVSDVDTAGGMAYWTVTAAELNVGDTFTIEVWVKRASMGVTFGIGDSDPGAWAAYIFNDKVHLTENGGAVVCNSSTTIDTNWHHIVLVKNGATAAFIYVDGVDVTENYVDNTLAGDADMRVGDTAAGFHDEFALYPTALSSARVLAHYNAGATVSTDSAAIYQSDRLRKQLRAIV